MGSIESKIKKYSFGIAKVMIILQIVIRFS